MKTILFISAMLILSSLGYSQENYNLPPGSVVKQKAVLFKDISYKLNDNPDFSQVEAVNRELFKDLSESNLNEMKELNPESHLYFTLATNYFSLLSDKVKAIYTSDELWYIYQFDQKLKETLKNLN
jgi:hypothetical protein